MAIATKSDRVDRAQLAEHLIAIDQLGSWDEIVPCYVTCPNPNIKGLPQADFPANMRIGRRMIPVAARMVGATAERCVSHGTGWYGRVVTPGGVVDDGAVLLEGDRIDVLEGW